MDYQNPLSPSSSPTTTITQQKLITSSTSSSSSPSTSPYSSTPSPPLGSTNLGLPPVSSSTPASTIVTTIDEPQSKQSTSTLPLASTSDPVIGLTDKLIVDDKVLKVSNSSNKSKSKKSTRSMKSTTEITQQAAIAAIFPPFSSSTSSLSSSSSTSSSSSSSSSSTASCSSSCSLEVPIVASSPSSSPVSSSLPTSLDSTCRVVDVKEIANTYRDDLKEWIDQSRARPRLVGFLANRDASAITYAKWTQRSCEDIGIKFELRQVEREDLEEGIIEANEDRRVDGIMVYYPVFGGGHDQYMQNCVSPFKDVEGLCHTFRFNMYHNIRFIDVQKKSIIPCTPLAIVKILDYLGVYNHDFDYGDQLNGKVITVINRSEVVGRPLAALLANDGAKTYSVDLDGILQFHRGPGKQKHRVTSTDKTLEDVLPLSDVVIAGVPDKKFKVPTKLLKPGVVAINFSTDRNFLDSVKEKASVFVPAIGKMTIVMLQRNLMRLYDYRRDAPFRFRFS